MTYEKLQFIGYAIDTDPGRTPSGQKTYLGLPNQAEDIDARSKLMLRAMETAKRNLAAASPPDSVLKVFVAPEFFFRGDKGAYDLDHVQLAVRTLQQMVSGDEWKDWLFVFGTIVGFWDQDKKDADKLAINYALIQEGGAAASGPMGARIVSKELKSHIDFIASATKPGEILIGEVEHLDAGTSGTGRDTQKLAYDGAGIFEACGIMWAAEICLDHLKGRLLQSPMLPGEQQVQVQLVPSGGASIVPGNIITEHGGYVFNVDGHINPNAVLNRFDPPATLVQPASVHEVNNAAVELTGNSPVEEVVISNIFAKGAGKVSIYDPVDTPNAATVPGTVGQLIWDTEKDFTFTFDLIYGEDGGFTTALCQITCPELPMDNNKYFLPLNMKAKDRDGDDIKIQSQIGPGARGYDQSCRLKVQSSRFNFGGITILFDTDIDGKKPEVSW